MDIVFPLYPDYTALDAIGPYEVLSRLPGAKVTFVAAEPGVLRTDTGFLGISADAALADIDRADVLVVPGGTGTRQAMSDEGLVGWIRHIHGTTEWTTSVCTGSLLLGAAGLLTGKKATTHWGAKGELEATGATYVAERVVVHPDEKIITAAGVSAGIDMGLTLAAALAGDDVARAIQLGIEYDPQPPFDSGSEAKADQATVERLIEIMT
jgi:putative intracellular protease/amidase